MSVEIRLATPADRDRCIAIVFDSLRAFGIEPEPEGMDADVMRFGDQAGGAYEILAVVDGAIAGVSSLSLRGENQGWLSKMFVAKELRRRGAAKALMNAIVAEAKSRGYARIGLQTRTIFTEAIALYEASGWTRGDGRGHGPCDRTYVLDLARV